VAALPQNARPRAPLRELHLRHEREHHHRGQPWPLRRVRSVARRKPGGSPVLQLNDAFSPSPPEELGRSAAAPTAAVRTGAHLSIYLLKSLIGPPAAGSETSSIINAAE
jgi:hypothetical protein